ncbi:MAG: hypothetical protein DRP94_08570 [Candidatus Latescibacterota bacterium]|nr:MAG: hypothetical protein DRP94_08570 [Candidatus Latescibacterota bacterium]
MVKLRKEDVVAFVEGHRRAEEVTKVERARRLASLTPEEAREEFLALWRLWRRMGEGELGPLEEERRRSSVEMRRKLYALYRKRQGGPP